MPDSNLADGGVLTSTFYNTYIREQVVVTCTSATRPTGVEGRLIYETNTDALLWYNGSAWKYLFSAWTAFTPAWGNLTEGNATNEGQYRYVAGDLHLRATITFGSTTSITGAVNLTLPNSETSNASAPAAIGAANYLDSGTAVIPGTCSVGASSTTVSFFADNTVTATVPFTFTTSDAIRCTLVVPL